MKAKKAALGKREATVEEENSRGTIQVTLMSIVTMICKGVDLQTLQAITATRIRLKKNETERKEPGTKGVAKKTKGVEVKHLRQKITLTRGLLRRKPSMHNLQLQSSQKKWSECVK